MLNGLSGRDQAGIESLAARKLLHDLLAFFDDALNGLAFDALGLRTTSWKTFSRRFSWPSVSFRCTPSAPLRSSDCAASAILGQRLEDGVLGEIGVLELMEEESVKVFLSHGVVSWSLVRNH